MNRLIQALRRLRRTSNPDRTKSVITEIPGRPHHDANNPRRPRFETEPRRRREKLRLGGPRYVRDGNLITLVPPFNGGADLRAAVNTAALKSACTCGVILQAKKRVGMSISKKRKAELAAYRSRKTVGEVFTELKNCWRLKNAF